MPHAHEGYESGWDVITRFLGEGLGKGAQTEIDTREAERRTAQGFGRLAPHRRAKFEEELGQATELGQAKGRVEQGFAAETEQRARAKEMEDRGALYEMLGPVMEPMLPPVSTMGVAPQATAEVLRETPIMGTRPAKISPKTPLSGYTTMAGMIKASKPKDPRQRTMPEWRSIAETMGHPEQAHAKSLLAGIQTEKRDLASFIIGEKPVSPSEAVKITDLESLQRRIDKNVGGTAEERRKRAQKYLSPKTGATAGVREWFNQLTGGRLMDPNEQNYRGIIIDITDSLARARSGGVIPEPEYQRLIKIVPNLGMAPENFASRMEQFYEELGKTLARRKQLANQPRRELAGRMTSGIRTFPGVGGSIFLEETDEGEEE